MVGKFSNYKSSKDFVTLSAWKKARLTRIFFYAEVVPVLPADEKYNLGLQFRRASVSTTANISKGYGRFHFKEGIRHYRIARRSLYELKDHLIACFDLKYIDRSVLEKGIALIEQAKSRLTDSSNSSKRKQNNAWISSTPSITLRHWLPGP
jgi:four helix bundle protein